MSTVNQIPEILRANIEWHIELIAVQVGHADKVQGRAKSGYYKIAILLVAAVVEALAHLVLEKALAAGATPSAGQWESYECHDLPPTHQPTTYRLAICKRRQPIFKLTGKTDFVKVNEVSRDIGIFSPSFFTKIERVRTTRNRIHLQGLDKIDRSYTKKQLESVSHVMQKLIDKLT